MKDYVRPPFDRVLEAVGLADFEALWALERDWFEPPNERRGRWSGVCRKTWPEPDSPTGEGVFFFKVQENHKRATRGTRPSAARRPSCARRGTCCTSNATAWRPRSWSASPSASRAGPTVPS